MSPTTAAINDLNATTSRPCPECGGRLYLTEVSIPVDIFHAGATVRYAIETVLRDDVAVACSECEFIQEV